MRVYVRFGAGVAHTRGSSAMEIALGDDAKLADLTKYIREQHPLLAQRLIASIPVVGGKAVQPSEPLADGQEVLFISAVAGGS